MSMKTSRLRREEALAGWGFVLPAFALIVLFGFVPVMLAGWVSLYDFPLVNPARRQFIGLANYVQALSDPTVRRALLNTIYYAIWQMPMQTGLGLLLALLIVKPTHGIGIFRAGFYLPVVISMVVASVVWRILLDQQNGLINSALATVHLPMQPFLNSTGQALPSLAVMLSWKWMGASMLIFLAGLNSIPPDYHEAAQIDGANTLQRFWHITLPLLRRPGLYVLVTNTISSLKLFTPVYVITNGGPQESTLSMIFYIFREGFTYSRMGYASSIAVLFALFLLTLAIAQLRLMRTEAE